jgi:alkylation response protein AidB-like acyl-CoA dehydrogenase/AcrR family transcriptional regulator
MSITPIWSPVLEPAAARWLALVAQVPEASETTPALVALREVGLFALLLPKQKKISAGASLTALFCVLEALAAKSPISASALAQTMAGIEPIMRLGSLQQKKTWLAWMNDGDGVPPALVRNLDAALDSAPMSATPDQASWLLTGRGSWVAASDRTKGFVVFAAENADQMPARISAFVVPGDTPGLLIEPAASAVASANEGRLVMEVRADASLLLGAAGQAAQTMANVLWVDRLASAAQANGMAIAAYEEARKTLESSHSAIQVAPRSAVELASCATAISASRMMLYEAARAADAGEDVRLLSSMALLCASDCAERMLAVTLQIAGGHASVDAARLQRYLAARRLQQAAAGPADAQATRIARAVMQPPKPLKGRKPVMTKPAPASAPATRTAEAPNRVSEILDAAADAFTQQGYDATTLDYIGDVLGVTKGSIYYHYRSKADLFVAVYRRVMEMNLETVSPIADDEQSRPLDRLYRMAFAHSLQVMKHLSYQRVAVQGIEAHLMGRVNEEQRARLNEVILLRDRYQEMFVRLISQAIEAGELPEQDARLAVKPLFGAINHTTMWYQPRPGETSADREHLAAHLANFVVSGLMQSYPVPQAHMQLSPTTAQAI